MLVRLAATARVALLVVAFLLIITSPSLAQTFRSLPDRSLTSGAVYDLTLRKICGTKWGSDARKVTPKMKQSVINAYHFSVATCPFTVIKGKRVRRAEIDHLIPRSIGGADDPRNLWPQCYEPPNKDKSKQADGANKKDRLERQLNILVCKARSLELLKEYQRKISNNWIALYHEIYGDQ